MLLTACGLLLHPSLTVIAPQGDESSSSFLATRASAQSTKERTKAGNGLGSDSLVVFLYHRFGDKRYPSTNTTSEQWESQLTFLESEGFTVVDLASSLEKLKKGQSQPSRAVAITIDDGFRSFFENGFPLLKARGWPFTLFLATGPVDERNSDMMTWDQIRTLSKHGGRIEAHTISHLHMPGVNGTTLQKEIITSQQRITKEVGRKPRLFAYPYGEADLTSLQLAEQLGFEAAFGQHSGSIGKDLDWFYLPRYPINESYGNLDRYRTAAYSVAMPVEIEPRSPWLGEVSNPPRVYLNFTRKLLEPSRQADAFACYRSDGGKLDSLNWAPDGKRLGITLTKTFPKGRTRVNCTLQAGPGRWHWFGYQWLRSE